MFHTPRQVTLQGKGDTGAMATCVPLSMLQNLGLTRADIMPTQAHLRGVTGTDMKTYGKINAKVMCNKITHDIQLLVTELGFELILGLEFCTLFNLVAIADGCMQQQIDINIEAVHIISENEVDYTPLKAKRKEHLPLGKKTGDAFKDLTLIFLSTSDACG